MQNNLKLTSPGAVDKQRFKTKLKISENGYCFLILTTLLRKGGSIQPKHFERKLNNNGRKIVWQRNTQFVSLFWTISSYEYIFSERQDNFSKWNKAQISSHDQTSFSRSILFHTVNRGQSPKHGLNVQSSSVCFVVEQQIFLCDICRRLSAEYRIKKDLLWSCCNFLLSSGAWSETVFTANSDVQVAWPASPLAGV